MSFGESTGKKPGEWDGDYAMPTPQAFEAAYAAVGAWKHKVAQSGETTEAAAALMKKLDLPPKNSEVELVQEAAKASVQGIPSEVRAQIPAEIIQAILTSRTYEQLGEHTHHLNELIEQLLAAEHSTHKAVHATEMSEEEQRKKLQQAIDKNFEKMDKLSQRLDKYKTDEERAEEEKLKKAVREASTPEEKHQAQRALNAHYNTLAPEIGARAGAANDSEGVNDAGELTSQSTKMKAQLEEYDSISNKRVESSINNPSIRGGQDISELETGQLNAPLVQAALDNTSTAKTRF